MPTGIAMENDILSAIVEVEREIQERLAAEERTAEEMLDRLRRELADGAQRDEERLAAEVRQAVAAAADETRERAAAIVRDAASRAERLAGLDDEPLERCVMKHLARILPGEGQ